MLSLFWTRLMVWASSSAMLSCFTLLQPPLYGMESVNTISSIALFCTRSLAGPLMMQWLARARMLRAPFCFSRSAAVNEKWGLEHGDNIHETGARHKSFEEELETKRRAVKGLTTMIENLTRQQEEIQSQIEELKTQQHESDSNKEDILRQIKFLNQTLTEIRVNLREKKGKLDQVNQELDSLKSTYNAKLKGLDAIMKKDNVMINYINRDAEIILKASIFDQVLYEAVKICREIPEADAMAEDTFIDDRNNFRWKDVLSTGLRVFIAGIDGATGVAQVSGGGGTSNDMPWRDKDEDFLVWARRVMRYAHAKHYPGNRFKRSLSK